MPYEKSDPRPDEGGPESTDQVERRIIDSLIDDMGAQSFPASDPPAWGTVSSRLEETEQESAPIYPP